MCGASRPPAQVVPEETPQGTRSDAMPAPQPDAMPAPQPRARETAAQMFERGLQYFKGEGVEQDLPEAARIFTIAAEGGDATAQWLLGIMCIKVRP